MLFHQSRQPTDYLFTVCIISHFNTGRSIRLIVVMFDILKAAIKFHFSKYILRFTEREFRVHL